ncbi:MAG: type 1 glutamine amidotransferase domain-containing protein [Chromatiales bacterium]|jgi:putative intracellular protease/amidase|nr:type 1 glutamine amidotransferase domain-containing protein [Chromatiales bacterium]MDX9766959.1 type 1 glutamine amidotransferase domain-containing protein [Ectothiorhodospiraceae bacterium]
MNDSTAGQKVLFVLTSHDRKGNTGQPTGFYAPEAAHPWAVLRAAGFDVDFASPRGGHPPMEGGEQDDPVLRGFLADAEVRRKLADSLAPEAVRAQDYAAILFVGGHGTMWDFPDHAGLARIAASIYEAGGVVGAVCHGPSALVNLKLSDGSLLVAGKRVAAFTDDEERAVGLDRVVPFLLAGTLASRGATHVPAPNWQANVVVDGRLVTGQNPASADGVGREMSRLLTSGA